MQRASVIFLSLVMLACILGAVFAIVKTDSWCVDKGGLLIRTSIGQVCIKEDVIIKKD